MISALAIQNNFNTSKHMQLIGWFNKNYIAANKVDIEHGKTAMRLFELRNKADYDVYASFTRGQTMDLYNQCQYLIINIEKLLINK